MKTSHSYRMLFVLLLVALTTGVESTQQLYILQKENAKLNLPVLMVTNVTSIIQCSLTCLKTTSCQCFNFGIEGMICELFNLTSTDHFESATNWNFYTKIENVVQNHKTPDDDQQVSKHFLYSQPGGNWYIEELHVNGSVGGLTSNGSWEINFDMHFVLTIKASMYLYLSESSSGKWSSIKIFSDGRLGTTKKSGTLPEGLHVQIPFGDVNEMFMFGQNRESENVYIFKFNSDGEISEETYSDHWGIYKILLAYQMENTLYLYGTHPGRWFINVLNGNNFADKETHNGYQPTDATIQFTFMENNTPHLFIRHLDGDWYVKKFIVGGKLSTKKETTGRLLGVISNVFPLSLSGKQYIYVYNNSKKHWYIQELQSLELQSVLQSGNRTFPHLLHFEI